MDKIDQKSKTKTLLIGKELKKKTYCKPRRNGQANRQQNPTQTPRIASAKGRVKPLRGSYAALRPCG